MRAPWAVAAVHSTTQAVCVTHNVAGSNSPAAIAILPPINFPAVIAAPPMLSANIRTASDAVAQHVEHPSSAPPDVNVERNATAMAHVEDNLQNDSAVLDEYVAHGIFT